MIRGPRLQSWVDRTELEAKQELTRSEITDHLREFAAELDTSGAVPGSDRQDDNDWRVTFLVGNNNPTINPSETIPFEIDVDSDTSFIGNEAEHEVEFGLTWRGGEPDTDDGEEELEIR